MFHRNSRRLWRLSGAGGALLVAVGLLLMGGPAAAQTRTGASENPVAEAIRLRDSRDFGAAARLLERYVAERPDDADARLLLAQALYWSGEIPAAEARYQEALADFPRHLPLRLEFGRMLAELNRPQPARRVLDPLRNEPAVAAEAEALLGQLAYWAGDLSAAAAHFRAALRHAPHHQLARRLSEEILLASATRFHLRTGYARDSQPIERLELVTGAVWFVTPLQTVAFHAHPQRIEFAGGSTSVTVLRASSEGYWPRLRLETQLAAGLLDQAFAEQRQWVGRAAVGLRLPAGVRLRGIGERAPYHHTVASLRQAVMTTRLQGLLALQHPDGWLGEASLQEEHFPDDNRAWGAHAWLLAPVLRGQEMELLAGYGFGYQDAQQSRYSAAPRQAGALPDGLHGVYTPYYTPEQVQTHSLAAAFSLRLTPGIGFEAGGSYGVYATEMAPYLVQTGQTGVGQTPQRAFYQRRFSPYTARAALSLGLAPALRLRFGAEAMRTAYWNNALGEAQIEYRFHTRSPTSPIAR